MIGPTLRHAIIIVVTAVWAANFVAGILIEGYETDQTINAIFMAVVGGLFALERRDGGGKSDGDGGGGSGGGS